MEKVQVLQKSQQNLQCAFCRDSLGKRVLCCQLCGIQLHDDCFRERYRDTDINKKVRCVTLGCQGLLANFESDYERVSRDEIIEKEEARRKARRATRRWLKKTKEDREAERRKIEEQQRSSERRARFDRCMNGLKKKKKLRIPKLRVSKDILGVIGICLGAFLGMLSALAGTTHPAALFAMTIFGAIVGLITVLGLFDVEETSPFYRNIAAVKKKREKPGNSSGSSTL
ncbi:MAG: hypothetical protein P1V97_19710 [Planctomycetota bacterium]|nr:hypothetical protein [Planctomycetota bacterium]